MENHNFETKSLHAGHEPSNTQGTRAVPQDLVRLSIGLEDIEDLKNDLKQAF